MSSRQQARSSSASSDSDRRGSPPPRERERERSRGHRKHEEDDGRRRRSRHGSSERRRERKRERSSSGGRHATSSRHSYGSGGSWKKHKSRDRSRTPPSSSYHHHHHHHQHHHQRHYKRHKSRSPPPPSHYKRRRQRSGEYWSDHSPSPPASERGGGGGGGRSRHSFAADGEGRGHRMGSGRGHSYNRGSSGGGGRDVETTRSGRSWEEKPSGRSWEEERRSDRESSVEEEEDVSHEEDIQEMMFIAPLPGVYYEIASDQVVRATGELNKIHLKMRTMFQSFTRRLPERCGFLSVLFRMQGIGVRAGGGGVLTRADSIHEHIPNNHPSLEPLFPSTDRCHDFGKGGEVDLDGCPPESWHVYRMDVSPHTNFTVRKGTTKIMRADGLEFTFQGFSVLSKHPLGDLPECTFERYCGQYKVKLVKDDTHRNYTLKDLLLFQEYMFVKLMEVFDWTEFVNPFCKELFFVPRFCGRAGTSPVGELLSMAEVLSYMVDNYQPLKQGMLEDLRNTRRKGVLVVQHLKGPSCIRVDRVSGKSGTRSNEKDIVLEHFCSQLQRKARNHSTDNQQKRREELESKKGQGKLSQKEHFELNSLRHDAQSLSHHPGEDYLALLSWRTFHCTGLFHDIPQHTLPLCVLSHHILLHDSLKCLQQRLGYAFRDTRLLHLALTHPSTTTSSFMVAEDHVRHALSNCGLRSTEFVGGAGGRASRGMKDLIKAVKNAPEETTVTPGEEGAGGVAGGQATPAKDRPLNNEQLEFLGDAVLEYICSKHLFLSHPDHDVGKLTQQRQQLVKNKHLIELAERVQLGDFLLRKMKLDFSEDCKSRLLSNCVEAVLGAVFLDGGLEEADGVFARLAFPEEAEYEEWMKPYSHPLMERFPDGDRHLLEESDTLKNFVSLEEKAGNTFKHVLLLAKAFVHSSCTDTTLTDGNYQRLEFLGDAILQFLVSKLVYDRFPAFNEGHLSLLRTSLVHNKQLSCICQELGFEKFIVTSKTETVELSTKIMADVVESFLAALTLDQGLQRAELFLQEHLFPKLKETVSKSQLVDANTRLNQAAAFTCKQQGLPLELPVFRLVEQEGPIDKPIFTIAVFVGKKKLAVGTGSSMREARSNASEAALQSGQLRIPPSLRD